MMLPRAACADEKLDFYEKKVRPLLVERCYKCHSATSSKLHAGLRVDRRGGLLAGGDSGPAIKPGDAASSLLFKAVSYTGGVSEMPPDAKLPASAIDDLKKWIDDGAVMPEDADPAAPKPRPVDIEQGRQFWSFKPVRTTPPPSVSSPEQANAVAGRLDAFVQQQLAAHDLAASPEADRRVLIRRLSLALRGLPPAFEEVQEFTVDGAPDAYARLVDRYLASPAYGQRWARHWLDVARFAEDNPTSEQTCKPPRFPFRYRDWVVDAMNEDLPYDDFVRRQLAADLLPVAPDQIAALGFLGLSPVYHKEPKLSADVITVIVADEWDERLDTITRGFLGLTVACARCHDHKFDPIRTDDYYALAGVMASTQLVEWPLTATTVEVAAQLTEVQRQLTDTELRLDYAKKMRDTAKVEGRDQREYVFDALREELKLKSLKAKPLFQGPIANAVRDAGLWIDGHDPDWTLLDYRPGVARDLPVFLRGNPATPGRVVPRGFIQVLSRTPANSPESSSQTSVQDSSRNTPPSSALNSSLVSATSSSPNSSPSVAGARRSASGRLELAEAIVTDAAPLTARVIVNRIWSWQFDRGLVGTPSNFGRLGDAPTHPELLDDLAARFIESNWSMKWLQREIVTSATWRQSSRPTARLNEVDPDNRRLARMTRHRLEPEPWRDALLSVSEQLDLTPRGASQSLDDVKTVRRSIYGTVSRQKPADVL
ncbi:MAG TPA: PSD1 and planctomycete cytochrome C domain-containing protein, partial [Pirellulaceae bacterium]|nr:PSD1 and planctomycete cytochrome C domain-containing protein [Pirellulaceae bacterium]